MKAYTLNKVQDKLIGKIGTARRDKFEQELKIELADKATKQAHQKHRPAKNCSFINRRDKGFW